MKNLRENRLLVIIMNHFNENKEIFNYTLKAGCILGNIDA